jgi:Cu/Zn superoxide dismutase
MKKEEEKEQKEKSTDEGLANPVLGEKLNEIANIANEDLGTDGKPAMLALVQGKEGVHIHMTGDAQDVAVMIASTMAGHQLIGSIIYNANMLFAMRQQQVASQVNPEEIENPKTKA